MNIDEFDLPLVDEVALAVLPQCIASVESHRNSAPGVLPNEFDARDAVELAYMFAEAMVAERKKRRSATR